MDLLNSAGRRGQARSPVKRDGSATDDAGVQTFIAHRTHSRLNTRGAPTHIGAGRGGFVTTRGRQDGGQTRRLTRAQIACGFAEPVARRGLGAMLVLASGAALAALSGWAVAAFLAGWTIQALYLLWNDRAVRIAEPTALSGRRRSVHAFAGYTAVTALVLCLPMLGVLG